MMETIVEGFKLLASETEDLYAPRTIRTTRKVPMAMEFLRNHVNPNVPLLIKGGGAHWGAVSKWDPKYLVAKLKNKKVTVAVTPNGYADAIASQVEKGLVREYFVMPEERSMHISDLFAKLQGDSNCIDASVAESKGVFYLQKQDSNLTKELPELLPDIDASLSWASEALGSEPSAINLWVGDARSVTSLHKDPFENIYCVVAGYKDFILLPPTDRPWLPYRTLRSAVYKETSPGQFVIEPTPENQEESLKQVPWITIDPLSPKDEDYLAHAHPLNVRVEAGDLLYLPSLWFHHVRQSDGCIAVNFWYDMSMDVKFVYYQFLEHLSRSRENHHYCSEPNI